MYRVLYLVFINEKFSEWFACVDVAFPRTYFVKIDSWWGGSSFHLLSIDAEAIEVLVCNGAYVVKKVGTTKDNPDAKGRLGQVTWSKFGDATHAWDVACERANFV